MWPWSKIKQLEKEISELLSHVRDLEREISRLTDRDSRGRFKR